MALQSIIEQVKNQAGDGTRLCIDGRASLALVEEIERLRGMLARWSALDGGAWAIERHAREKSELLAETRALLNPS